MSQDIQKSGGQDRKLNAIIGIMALVTLFGPAHAQVSEWSSSVIAMTWQWYAYEWDSQFMFNPLMLFASLPYTFLRPVFVAMFYRLYKAKSSKKRVLIVGLLSELVVELIYYPTMIFYMLMSPWGWYSISWIFPIPLLFGVGLLYMKLVPPPEVTSWADESEPSYWWTDKEKEKHEETPKEKPKDKPEVKSEEKPEVKPEEEAKEEPEEKEPDIWMD